MSNLKRMLCLLLSACLVLEGCARFKPTPMPIVEPQNYPYQFSKEGVDIRVATFTRAEVEKYFAANLTKKNVWPFRVNIQNASPKTYLFAKGMVEPNRISSHEAARKGRRSAGWRFTWGLLFWASFFGIPIAIPLFVTGFQALGANSYMEREFKNWEIFDKELKPGDKVSGILFFSHPSQPQEIQIQLMDAKTNEQLAIPIDLSKKVDQEISGELTDMNLSGTSDSLTIDSVSSNKIQNATLQNSVPVPDTSGILPATAGESDKR